MARGLNFISCPAMGFQKLGVHSPGRSDDPSMKTLLGIGIRYEGTNIGSLPTKTEWLPDHFTVKPSRPAKNAPTPHTKHIELPFSLLISNL